MKPVLKALGTVLLKLRCEEALSNFAFNFNLRRYTRVRALRVRLRLRRGLADVARRVIGCHSTQETRVHSALDDVASVIRQAVDSGTAQNLTRVTLELEAGAYTRPLFGLT